MDFNCNIVWRLLKYLDSDIKEIDEHPKKDYFDEDVKNKMETRKRDCCNMD